ncbi:MAG: Hsp70 family protein, partial [Bacteroidales bacterium]
ADKAEKEKIDKVNGADAMIFQTEKNLKDYGDKLSAGTKSGIESALNDLRNAKSSGNVADIDRCSEALNKAWYAASDEMQKAAQGGPQAGPQGPQAGPDPNAGFNPNAGQNPNDGSNGNGGNGGNNGGDPNVTDADYEEVK